MWSIGHQWTASTSRGPVLMLLVNPMWLRPPSSLARLLFPRCSLVCLSSFVLEGSTEELFLRCCLLVSSTCVLSLSTSGCVVECRICNWECAGSHLSLGYFAPPKSTQPSIPLGSVNEYQLRLGRQRQVWLIPIADERVGMQVKLWNPLRTLAIPELSASAVVIHYEEAIYQVSACTFMHLLPSSFKQDFSWFLVPCFPQFHI